MKLYCARALFTALVRCLAHELVFRPMYVRTASQLIGSQNPFSSVFQSVYNNRDYDYVMCIKAINNYKSGFAGFASFCECHGCHATWDGPVPGCSRVSRLFITSTSYPEIFSKRLGGIFQSQESAKPQI